MSNTISYNLNIQPVEVMTILNLNMFVK